MSRTLVTVSQEEKDRVTTRTGTLDADRLFLSVQFGGDVSFIFHGYNGEAVAAARAAANVILAAAAELETRCQEQAVAPGV